MAIPAHWYARKFPGGIRLFYDPDAFLGSNVRSVIESATMTELKHWLEKDFAPTAYKWTFEDKSKDTLTTIPSDRQVGGDHYKSLAVEPWKAMESWLSREEYIGFLRGNIIKYQARANSGKEDKELQIAKAKHYADELESFLSRSKSI